MEFLMEMMDYLLITIKRFFNKYQQILTVINIFDRSFSLKCLVYICDPIKPYEKKMKDLISFLVFASRRKESTNQLILSAFFNASIDRVMRNRLVVACIFHRDERHQIAISIPHNINSI
jgi:hypothetical protein